LNDLSRSLNPLDPDGTLIAVIELSLSSWLVAGIVPGVERQPLKKLAVDESALGSRISFGRRVSDASGCEPFGPERNRGARLMSQLRQINCKPVPRKRVRVHPRLSWSAR
jgi:hypothetical protein